MDLPPNDIITATVPEFCRVSGNGRSKTYELLAEGRLQSIKIGKRRLIVINSYRQLVNDLLSEAEGQQQAVATTNTARRASANRPDLTTVSCPSDPRPITRARQKSRKLRCAVEALEDGRAGYPSRPGRRR